MPRRRVARPFSPAVRPTRLVSLLFAVALLLVIYDRAKDEGSWHWLTGEKAKADDVAAPGPGRKGPDWEKIDANLVPGPNDRDPAEKELGGALLELVGDKSELASKEQSAYWRLMSWARAEPFESLEKRARKEIPFIQLWEQPEQYRGELVRLRLHVARVLEFKAPERNDRVPPTVYEAWGWTDDSKDLPYVVVFPDLPEGLKTGQKVSGEIVFVGYFLKVMSYTPADATADARFRGAPLFVGRARPAVSAAAKAPARRVGGDGGLTTPVVALIAAGVVGIVGLGLWSVFRGKPARAAAGAPAGPRDIDLGGPGPEPEFRLDLSPPADRGILPPAPRPDEPS